MQRNTEVLMALRAVTSLYSQEIRKIGDRYGLAPIEANIISFLDNNPGLDRASDIIELRGFSKAIVSEGIDSLAEKGLLVRQGDAKDGRIVHLSLAPQAASAAAALKAARRQFLGRCFAGFSAAERQAFSELSGRIIHNLIGG